MNNADFWLLWDRIAEWSQRTFGTDDERGPIGPLKHLAKEAAEAAADPHDLTEYADCLILLMDATRRGRFTLAELLHAAHRKQTVNESRTWPRPTEPDAVAEHAK